LVLISAPLLIGPVQKIARWKKGDSGRLENLRLILSDLALLLFVTLFLSDVALPVLIQGKLL
jgi:hypothetical protein